MNFSWYFSSELYKIISNFHEANTSGEKKYIILTYYFYVFHKYLWMHLKNSAVIHYEIPNYPELSVKSVWSLVQENADMWNFCLTWRIASSQKRSFYLESLVHLCQKKWGCCCLKQQRRGNLQKAKITVIWLR